MTREIVNRYLLEIEGTVSSTAVAFVDVFDALESFLPLCQAVEVTSSVKLRWLLDDNPTVSYGHVVQADTFHVFPGAYVGRLRFISTGADATVMVTFRGNQRIESPFY